jgi:hypothetical protein
MMGLQTLFKISARLHEHYLYLIIEEEKLHCPPCRKAKVRCGHERPCSRCTSRGMAEKCEKNYWPEFEGVALSKKDTNASLMSHFESLRFQAEKRFNNSQYVSEASTRSLEAEIQSFSCSNYFSQSYNTDKTAPELNYLPIEDEMSNFEMGNSGKTTKCEEEEDLLYFAQDFQEDSNASPISNGVPSFQASFEFDSLENRAYSSVFMRDRDFTLDSSFKGVNEVYLKEEPIMTVNEVFVGHDELNHLMSSFDDIFK